MKSFEEYLKEFDYQSRKDMKIQTKQMLELVSSGEAQLIDIRFKEEYEAWSVAKSKNIPLNELPDRLDELDKNKIIITACPHNDRSNMARLFLTLNGFNAKYLTDGLLNTMDFLRGDNARDFINKK
ncbi:hypothetical protein MNB_ARC-1_1114 [hydrothermal vent metagenome]|uniref:Rhodanese domain-containing protein n=1 Tax=hydrothermal vent metagenome TaxID=652676 RepID=A0A3B1DSE8_9ZZZZ